MPPLPIGETTSYGPRRVPEVRAICILITDSGVYGPAMWESNEREVSGFLERAPKARSSIEAHSLPDGDHAWIGTNGVDHRADEDENALRTPAFDPASRA